MTPKWPWTIQGQSYPIYVSLILSPSLKYHSIFLYDQPFSGYKVVNKQKYTKWPQNDLEHLTAKKYPIYIKNQPPRFKFLSVSLYDQLFSRHRLSKIGKIGNAPIDLRVILTIKNTVYKCIKYLPTRPKFSFCLLYDQPFSRYKIAENRKFQKCTQWPHTDFEILKAKSASVH